MKTGIIGLPQVGKTSLFKILTKAKLEDRGHSREAHIGVARVPDERLDKLSALYSPKKTTYATVEYVDVAAIGQEALKETAFLTSLRNVDALIHVLRAFEDESIAHVGPIDPLRDIKNVEFDLMISDLTQVEKRLERLEKDLERLGRNVQILGQLGDRFAIDDGERHFHLFRHGIRHHGHRLGRGRLVGHHNLELRLQFSRLAGA